MRWMHVLLAALALALPAQHVMARGAELVDPPPVAIPAALTQEQVVKDIKRALMGRGWAVSTEQPGQIESTLNLRDHQVRIRIGYDATQVRLAYLDSRNLDFEEKKGKRYIHSNYLGWMNFLVGDISTNFKLTAEGA